MNRTNKDMNMEHREASITQEINDVYQDEMIFEPVLKEDEVFLRGRKEESLIAVH